MPSQQETNEKSTKRYENNKDSPEVSEEEDAGEHTLMGFKRSVK